MTLPKIGSKYEHFNRKLAKHGLTQPRPFEDSPSGVATNADLNILSGGGGIRVADFSEADDGPTDLSGTHKALQLTAKKTKTLPDEARLQRLAQHQQLKEFESNSFFDTKFDNLYNKLEQRKDKEVESYVKQTKEMQKAAKWRDLRNSMDDLVAQSRLGAESQEQVRGRPGLDTGEVLPAVGKSGEQRLRMLNQLNQS